MDTANAKTDNAAAIMVTMVSGVRTRICLVSIIVQGKVSVETGSAHAFQAGSEIFVKRTPTQIIA